MQSVSSRIWTRVVVFISYDDNHYTITFKKCVNELYTFNIYVWQHLALNNPQVLVCHKPKQTNKKQLFKYKYIIANYKLTSYSKVKLVIIVEGDQKAPFSIATTPKCRRGRYSFPWFAPLYPRYVPYIAEW